MFVWIVLPVLIVAVFMGLDSWPWRILVIAASGASLYWLKSAGIAVVVALIIGIALKNSLSGISGSKV